MQISKRCDGKIVELKVEGRMDVYWAEHLATAVNQEIRAGSHHIRLDLSQVPYLSSAGIGVLVRLHRELRSIHGSFAVANCSRTVLKALEITNLGKMLVAPDVAESLTSDAARSGGAAEEPAAQEIRRIEHSGAVYEIYGLAPGAILECRRVGDAGPLERCEFGKKDCRTMQFSDTTFAIGLGALGEDYEDGQGRFGEFIAAGGAVAYLPTDGTNVPDFLLGAGTALPEVQVCYGIACEGAGTQAFRHLMRFEAEKSGEHVPLSAVLEACLEAADTERIGLVMIAESAGLIGAALRRTPVANVAEKRGSDAGIFEFPKIREWLSFTAEPSYTKSVALLAGIAIRGDAGALTPVVRPVAGESGSRISGHIHAAAFSYRPLQKGQIDVKESIKALFEGQALEGILHLLRDDRERPAGGQSQFVRGACWLAPIGNIAVEGAQE